MLLEQYLPYLEHAFGIEHGELFYDPQVQQEDFQEVDIRIDGPLGFTSFYASMSEKKDAIHLMCHMLIEDYEGVLEDTEVVAYNLKHLTEEVIFSIDITPDKASVQETPAQFEAPVELRAIFFLQTLKYLQGVVTRIDQILTAPHRIEHHRWRTIQTAAKVLLTDDGVQLILRSCELERVDFATLDLDFHFLYNYTLY